MTLSPAMLPSMLPELWRDARDSRRRARRYCLALCTAPTLGRNLETVSLHGQCTRFREEPGG